MGNVQGEVRLRVEAGALQQSLDDGRSWAAVSSGGFGSDTTVQLPNSAAALVDSLRLVLSLPDNTAGNEDAQWSIRLRRNGAMTEMVRITDNILYAPDNLFFLSDVAAGTGFNWPATGFIYVYTNGTRRAYFSNAAFNTSFPITFGAGAATIALATNSLQIKPNTAGFVDFGFCAGAYATNATDGFPTMPTCAGAATGAASVAAGQAAFIYDSTNNKIYVRSGGTWRSTAALT